MHSLIGEEAALTGWSNSPSKCVLRPKRCGTGRMLPVSVPSPMHWHRRPLEIERIDRHRRRSASHFDPRRDLDPFVYAESCTTKRLARQSRSFLFLDAVTSSNSSLLNLRSLFLSCFSKILSNSYFGTLMPKISNVLWTSLKAIVPWRKSRVNWRMTTTRGKMSYRSKFLLNFGRIPVD